MLYEVITRAGLKAIYVSGWQVAGDANLAQQTYPDQSLYPKNSVPTLVRRINNALLRADQVEWSREHRRIHDWLVPIVADAEAGFGGSVHAYELMKAMIEAGAGGVHFEDQLAAAKKCVISSYSIHYTKLYEMQQVKAGLKAIYLSGWQVAADANLAGEMYPDQSLYPANSVPQVRITSYNVCYTKLLRSARPSRRHAASR